MRNRLPTIGVFFALSCGVIIGCGGADTGVNGAGGPPGLEQGVDTASGDNSAGGGNSASGGSSATGAGSRSGSSAQGSGPSGASNDGNGSGSGNPGGNGGSGTANGGGGGGSTPTGSGSSGTAGGGTGAADAGAKALSDAGTATATSLPHDAAADAPKLPVFRPLPAEPAVEETGELGEDGG